MDKTHFPDNRENQKNILFVHKIMTCFWNALITGLPREIFQNDTQTIRSLRTSICSHHSPSSLVSFLQSNNKETLNVQIQNQYLSDQRKRENKEAVQIFDPHSIYGGYFCSAEDPFLFLVAELFQINIHHNFYGTLCIYTFINPQTKAPSCKTLSLHSSNGHMNFGGFR
jgi:hypothetical protein